MVSIDDMFKFEQKEMKKIRPIKNTWYDLLIIFLSLIRKIAVGFKDKIVSLFKTSTLKKKFVWERKETKQTKSTEH